MKKRILTLAALLAVAIFWTGCAGREEIGTTGTTAPSPTSAARGAGFEEAATAWGDIGETQARLDRAVEKNDFTEVRDATVKIRDSVNALPGKSAALPADKRRTLDSQVKEVDDLAGQLGAAADSNNTEAMHERHKAMNEALDDMMGLYPEDVRMRMEEHMRECCPEERMRERRMRGMGEEMRRRHMPGRER